MQLHGGDGKDIGEQRAWGEKQGAVRREKAEVKVKKGSAFSKAFKKSENNS